MNRGVFSDVDFAVDGEENEILQGSSENQKTLAAKVSHIDNDRSRKIGVLGENRERRPKTFFTLFIFNLYDISARWKYLTE